MQHEGLAGGVEDQDVLVLAGGARAVECVLAAVVVGVGEVEGGGIVGGGGL